MNTRAVFQNIQIFSMAVSILMISPHLASAMSIAIIDSGAQGYVDSTQSFTKISGDRDPLFHGTEVSRLIRKEAPGATLHMLQVCEKKDGVFKPSMKAIVEALKWCIKNRVDIINMSLVTKYNKEIENLVRTANKEYGIIVVAAAGNKTLSNYFAAGEDGFIRRQSVARTAKPRFPSSSPYVISVGAADSSGKTAKYSHGHADLYADGKARGQKGSSFSCARITGQIAGFGYRGKDKLNILAALQ